MNDDVLLSSIDVLNNAGNVWVKSPEQRAQMTLNCRDADYLPRVAGAGSTKKHKGLNVQIMHNGILVKQGGYQGQWEAAIISGLKGVHEPQEEKVFFEVLKRIDNNPTMIELGSWWSYYTIWFLKSTSGGRGICCEPDPNNIKLGMQNADLNNLNLGSQIDFLQCAAGSSDKKAIQFTGEDGSRFSVPVRSVDSVMEEKNVQRLDILHMDIQGVEMEALSGAEQSIKAGKVRFVFVSTHHYSISGNPRMHQDCLTFLKELGAHIVASHTVAESCSGDGLIVASFDKRDSGFQVPITLQPTDDSLFRQPEIDMSLLWDAQNSLIDELRTSQNKLNAANLEIQRRDEQIINLQTALDEVTPLRKHIKKHVRFQVSRADAVVTNKLKHKNKHKPKQVSFKTVDPLEIQKLDKDNFEQYNKSVENHPLLSVYQTTKRSARRVAKKIVRKS